MKKVAMIVVLVAVGVGLKMSRQGKDSEQVLSEIKELFAETDFYEADHAFMDELIEAHHGKAFREAYDIGSRRRAASFDEDKYVEVLLTEMISDCNRRKRRQDAATLSAFKAFMMAVE